jgi:hypothetical protein
MFNLMDTSEGDKVDFWMLTSDPFDRSRFERKQAEEPFGTKMNVSTQEDTILAKLKWAKLSGGSEKQLIDAVRVMKFNITCWILAIWKTGLQNWILLMNGSN